MSSHALILTKCDLRCLSLLMDFFLSAIGNSSSGDFTQVRRWMEAHPPARWCKVAVAWPSGGGVEEELALAGGLPFSCACPSHPHPRTSKKHQKLGFPLPPPPGAAPLLHSRSESLLTRSLPPSTPAHLAPPPAACCRRGHWPRRTRFLRKQEGEVQPPLCTGSLLLRVAACQRQPARHHGLQRRRIQHGNNPKGETPA